MRPENRERVGGLGSSVCLGPCESFTSKPQGGYAASLPRLVTGGLVPARSLP